MHITLPLLTQSGLPVSGVLRLLLVYSMHSLDIPGVARRCHLLLLHPSVPLRPAFCPGMPHLLLLPSPQHQLFLCSSLTLGFFQFFPSLWLSAAYQTQLHFNHSPATRVQFIFQPERAPPIWALASIVSAITKPRSVHLLPLLASVKCCQQICQPMDHRNIF